MQPKKGNFDYFTQAKRFEGYGSYLDRSREKIPGPGKYQQEELPKKKSFNLMFN